MRNSLYKGDAMKTRNILMILSGILISGTDNTLLAQDTPDDAAVWLVVQEQWDASENGDTKWMDTLLATDFTGWSNSSPAPRTKDSVKMWDKFRSKQWKGKAHELYPLSIVVHRDTAIVHYLYTNAGENAAGESKVINGRYTDVLVRIDGNWKFIAWHGGADDDD